MVIFVFQNGPKMFMKPVYGLLKILSMGFNLRDRSKPRCDFSQTDA